MWHQSCLAVWLGRPVEGIGVELPSEAVELKYTDICQIGEDIRIKCQVCDKKQEESCLQES